MDWNQKAQALNCLGRLTLCPSQVVEYGWYASLDAVEIKDGSILRSGAAHGATPEEAVDGLWRELVEDLPPEQYLVRDAYTEDRRQFRWTGFMWEDVTPPAVV